MTALDFNDKGQANVSFGEFDNYINERKEQSDYTEEKDGITYYYNGGGCLLAKYDNNEGYGFNPRTHSGCDIVPNIEMHHTFCFNPRTHSGCDANVSFSEFNNYMFQSTHPLGVRHR